MEYKNNEELDFVLKPFFKWKFKGWTFKTLRKPGEQSWTGFYNPDDNLIFGYVTDDKPFEIWYSDGQYFQGGPEIYGITYDDLNHALVRYVKTLKSGLEIQHVM